MTPYRNALLAGVAAIALSLGGPALAQDSGNQGNQGGQQPAAQAAGQQQAQPQQAQTGGGQQPGQAGQQAGTDGEQAGGGMQQGGDTTVGVTTPEGTDGAGQNLLIATVGEAEIREADVMAALRQLPPQARQQPPQVLVPAVVNQLILRELVLGEARGAGLEADPEVTAMAGGGGPEALEQALVQIWFQRELADRVTEEDIEAAYEDLKQANPDMQQSLAEVRPQIQNMLQRQAAAAVGTELRGNAEITFYDEAGEPVALTPQGGERGQAGAQQRQGGQNQQPAQ